jgi:thiosulfate/3-mercaptopyruvate sulfurtransferase
MRVRYLCLGLLLWSVLSGQSASDPWTEKETIQPDELVKILAPSTVVCAGSAAECLPPAVLMVGPRILYNGAHIVRALYAGPAGKPEGLENLTKVASTLVKGRRVVLYCGCCPMVTCPNIRPAFQKLKELGYENVRVLIIPTNLHDDWIAKGNPVEKGDVSK